MIGLGGEAAPDSSDASEEQARRARLRRDVVRFLGVRERTTREISDYLRRRGYAASWITAAVAELLERELVDDRRFAKIYLRDRQRLRPISRMDDEAPCPDCGSESRRQLSIFAVCSSGDNGRTRAIAGGGGCSGCTGGNCASCR